MITIKTSDFQNCATAESRFTKLKHLHASALALGRTTKVVYEEGMTLDLEIPTGATSIPLTNYTDFNGCILNVKNTNVTDFFLFSLSHSIVASSCLLDNPNDYNVLKARERIERGDYSSLDDFPSGLVLIVLEDLNQWTTREGYSEIVFLKDVILVKDKKALNSKITSYNNSNPRYSYYETDGLQKSFGKVMFNRDVTSTKQTRLLHIKGENEVRIHDLSIYTPPESLSMGTHPSYIDDRCIYVEASANVYFEDIYVDGTYSDTMSAGYAFRLDTIWNTSFRRVRGDALWGISCGYRLNVATIDSCEINRFDSHCLCRDFAYYDTVIKSSYANGKNAYCQLSSAYGYMRFDHCTFWNCRPIILEASYNAFTGFDLIFEHCTFYVKKEYYFLIQGFQLDNNINERLELQNKCLPNITMHSCHFRLPSDFGINVNGNVLRRYYLFHFENPDATLYQNTIGHIRYINMESVDISYDGEGQISVYLCNRALTFPSNLIRHCDDFCTFSSIS